MKLPNIGPMRVGTVAFCLAASAAWALNQNTTTSPGEAVQTPGQTNGAAAVTPGAGAPLSQQDSQFIQNAAKANMAQIALGFLAIEKGASDEVKEYGQQLVDSHVQTAKNLMELASRKNVYIPLETLHLPAEAFASLGKEPGKEFDKAFLKNVINSNTKAQAGLQQFLSQVQDKELRDFANGALSRVGEQISDARELGGALGIAAEELNPPPVAESPGSTPGAEMPQSMSPAPSP